MIYCESFDDIAANLKTLCDVAPVFSSLQTIIDAWRVANAVALSVPTSQTNKNDLLKLLTGFVVSTETDLNCYPTGLATTVCFDASGNPV
jgi:hypothetical protein